MRATFEMSVELFKQIFGDGEKPAHRIQRGIPEGAQLIDVALSRTETEEKVEGWQTIRFVFEGDDLPDYIIPEATTSA